MVVINITFEYLCDACGQVAVGADYHHHRADDGRYPVPRQIRRVGHLHVCERCFKLAERSLVQAKPT